MMLERHSARYGWLTRFTGMCSPRQRCAAGAARRGTATVELAVCLPVIVLMVFGSIETAHFIHLKQDLTICAYETAKAAAKRDATAEQVRERFLEIAAAKGVVDATIDLTPADIESADPGEEIRVLVRAPADTNRIMPLRYYQGRQLSATVVMVRQQY